jgi:hypothetical protein
MNVQDTVGVKIESNFDLWCSTWCWWDTFKVEFTEQVAVFGQTTFTFEYLNKYTWLVISISSESLGLLGWDGSVSWD